MARLRKFAAYRNLEKPYTRYSKYRNKNYVRARPVCKVVRFDMGDSKKYDCTLNLISKKSLQIRDNALESARQSVVRIIEKSVGKSGFCFQIKKYPHHILRENPLAQGAGADRMSTGMAHSFGKVMGIAAQVKAGDVIFTLSVPKQHEETARKALKQASSKLPLSYSIVAE